MSTLRTLLTEAVSSATKFTSEDVAVLQQYFRSAKTEKSFSFEWLDRLEKGGLTREEVLSVIHGEAAPIQFHFDVDETTTPKKQKPPTRKTRKQPVMPSPSRPVNTTPRTAPTGGVSAFTPPPKKPRSSKHEKEENYSSSDDEDYDE